eukprot:71638-Prorocentrum_minimum.AAC.1
MLEDVIDKTTVNSIVVVGAPNPLRILCVLKRSVTSQAPPVVPTRCLWLAQTSVYYLLWIPVRTAGKHYKFVHTAVGTKGTITYGWRLASDLKRSFN